MIRALAIVAALTACAAFAQTMYKWVDEKGVTHFSESPPPEGTKGAAKIDVKPVMPDKAPVDNWRERELESKQKRAVQGVRDENARRQEEAQAARRCSEAKRRVDTMTHSRRVYNLDGKGERVYLDDTQRAAQLEEARRDLSRNCP